MAAVLDFRICPKHKKSSKIGSKVIKTNINTIKWPKDFKNATRKRSFKFKIREIEIVKKYACQNMVAMKTSSHVGSYMPYQIVAI